ncbi:MAG: DUF5011 domain-containing protein [Coprobacillus sp.]
MQNKIITSILSMFLLVDVLLVYLALTVSPIKLKRLVFTYEYGEKISTDVGFYVNANPTILKSVKLNLSHVSTNVGKYQASIEYSGKKETFEVQVVDTVKPKVQLKKVEWKIQLGKSIKAQDLIEKVEDQSKTSVYFYDEETKTKSKQKSYNQEGSYIEKIIVEDEHKNQSASYRVKIVVETNKVLPIITGANDITIKVSEAFDPLKDIKATDDIEGDITSRMIHEGVVNNQLPGVYQIVYTVSDNAGNIGKVVRKVTVTE